MADFYTPTADDIKAWDEFVLSRPEAVKAVAAKLFPWKLYRMKSTGHRVTLYCLDENTDGTVTLQVDVTGEFNALMFDRRVFGISPDDLEECELPAEGEILGSALASEEVDNVVLDRIFANKRKRTKAT